VSDNSSNQVLNKLTAAVDGLVKNGVGITGEFKQGTVKMANDRDLGSISQTSTVPV